MPAAALTVARFTLLESRRSRVWLIAVGAVVACALAAEFGAALAITDSASYRSGLTAASARVVMVLVAVLFVATSVVREQDDRLLDLVLSRPLSRASWYCGRLLGFAVFALGLAALAAAPLAWSAGPAAALTWAVCFAAELEIMVAATLACVVTLRQVTPAVVAAAAFYVLARAIDAMVLLSRGPTVDAEAPGAALVAGAVEALAVLLPSLDRFGHSGWLDPGVAAGLAPVLGEAAIYVVLLLAVGLFDCYRHDG